MTPVHVVCPACLTTNRVPDTRLGQQPNCGKCRQPLFTGHPVALTQASFHRVIRNSGLPVVVDFWAPWCGPCKQMAPAYEQAARQLEPEFLLAKVDTEAEPGLGNQFGIRGIPTLVHFRGGAEVARHSGAIGANDIVRWVRSTGS